MYLCGIVISLSGNCRSNTTIVSIEKSINSGVITAVVKK